MSRYIRPMLDGKLHYHAAEMNFGYEFRAWRAVIEACEVEQEALKEGQVEQHEDVV